MARWGRSYGNDSMWAPYVPVAQRRAKAEREAATHAAETAARHLDQHQLEKDRE